MSCDAEELKYVTLDWLSARGLNKTKEIFAYKFLRSALVNTKIPVPILMMSNSCYAARPVGICMRSYDEFAQMASLLRPYINNKELPTAVPYMKRSRKKESMGLFLQWCGAHKEVLSLIAIQHFLYSLISIQDIRKRFKTTSQDSSAIRFKLLELGPNLNIPQGYEEGFLRENDSNEKAFNAILLKMAEKT